ncbi:MAG TPA: polyphosphate kinase 1 [Spongiibacteraceae bacterium]|nr:polyphosphate kinase 1 [Spongiibacteraceae bacterium]
MTSPFSSPASAAIQSGPLQKSATSKSTRHKRTQKKSREAHIAVPKELSWLAFNERVLQEAADPTVPPIARVHYLGIFSNNMDEFFRIRVAEVRRLATFAKLPEQEHYKQLLEQIQHRVIKQQRRFAEIYFDVLKELRKHKIYLIDEHQLDEDQAAYVRHYFERTIEPELEPILLDDTHPLPELADASIHFAIKLHCEQHVRYSLLEIPTDKLSRFVRIPPRRGQRGIVFIVLENIIRFCLPQVFRSVFPIQHAEAYIIKLTRDAELELDEGVTQSLMDRISSSIKRRRKADPVRFVYDNQIPEDLLGYLTRRLNLGRYDSLIPGGRYHNSKDFIDFPKVGPAALYFRPLPEVLLPELEVDQNIFASIQKQDILLYYPYHPFKYVIEFLKTAAIDPAVKSINISLYRIARQSHIVDALITAVRNHKKVTAVIELQARFDEEANIRCAKRMTEAGVNVIFSIPGLKVHCKLISVARHEGNRLRYYSHIGTGNFNEKTAGIYTDFSLLTHNQEIGADVANVFEFIEFTYRRPRYRHLFVSPNSNRSNLTALINNEIAAASAGAQSGITIKCNNLVDERIIDKLYEASQAGVKIRLIVRGMCALLAGKKGLSENIEAISIVDRFLEHPRIFVFCNRGAPLYFISSADLMERNLDVRVEVTCPVYAPQLQKQIQAILDLQWADNVKARTLGYGQINKMRAAKGIRLRSQEAIHRYLATGKLPAPLKR